MFTAYAVPCLWDRRWIELVDISGDYLLLPLNPTVPTGSSFVRTGCACTAADAMIAVPKLEVIHALRELAAILWPPPAEEEAPRCPCGLGSALSRPDRSQPPATWFLETAKPAAVLQSPTRHRPAPENDDNPPGWPCCSRALAARPLARPQTLRSGGARRPVERGEGERHRYPAQGAGPRERDLGGRRGDPLPAAGVFAAPGPGQESPGGIERDTDRERHK